MADFDKGSGGFFQAVQDASFGQILIWILLIVAIVWGFVAVTAMTVALLIALSICAICITIMLAVVKPLISPSRRDDD